MTICDLLDAIETSGANGVLATIIHIEGSAYLKEGTSMFFQEDGTAIGMVSAGCLETDLALQAQEVMQIRINKVVTYDLQDEDDLGWGQGAGCNGILSILLEYVDDRMRANLYRLREYLKKRVPVLHIKQLNEDLSQVHSTYAPMDGQFFGDDQWNDLPVFLHSLYKNMNPFRMKSGLQFFPSSASPVYFHLYEPKPHLVVWGAGPDARPLVSFAAHTDFSVTVCDWREALCRKEYFMKADRLVIGFPKEIMEELCLQTQDFVVVMTHNFQKDKEFLSYLIKQNLRYIAILGPAARTRRLLNGEDIPPFIHSPAGLAIGAKGPEQIAVSILAEMIQHLRVPAIERTHST